MFLGCLSCGIIPYDVNSDWLKTEGGREDEYSDVKLEYAADEYVAFVGTELTGVKSEV